GQLARAATSLVDRVEPRAVRLSITDRCDLACVYCRPSRSDGYLPASARLEVDDWRVIVRGLVDRGVRRVRITGGEPLVHPDVVEIVAAVAAIPGVEDLALTTNATQLRRLARPLHDAGLRRVNVSIDSLDRETFSQLSRGGDLDEVIAGIDAAMDVGFDELKTNTVVVADAGPGSRGNAHELAALAKWAFSRSIVPRFLELMSVGEGAKVRDRVVPYAQMRAALVGLLGDDDPARQVDRGPARYVSAIEPHRGHRVGFITGSSDTFCDGCDRLRVTSLGGLRPCLATSDEVSLRGALDVGDHGAVSDALDRAWAMKPDGRAWKGCTEASAADVNMRATGG
ncbi:MAG: GTP 3',8-cyclase MoaA, partial [Polyangiales bacterium]